MTDDTFRLTVDGPRCPQCGHREQVVTFQRIHAWGLPDGSAKVTHRECAAGCGWTEVEP